MKILITCILFIAGLCWASCKLENLNPNKTKTSNDTLKRSPADPTTHASLAGVWKWSAQYDIGAYESDLLNPANTGMQETLTLNTDGSWSQTKNGTEVNTGSYKLVDGITPGGPVTFLKFINSTKPVLQTYTDNFDFNSGFAGSYACSSDSLIFYGVYSTGQTASIATERVYIK